MRILVTGGAGFIGSALCRHLVGDLGHEVMIVDRHIGADSLASLRSIGDDACCHFAQADVTDRIAIDWLLDAFHPESIVHLAAGRIGEIASTSLESQAQKDVIATTVLLEAARAFWAKLPAPERDDFRLLHVSTDEIRGSSQPDERREEPRPARTSPYAASRAATSHLVSAWIRAYGLPVIIADCSNTYGPSQALDKLIPHTILRALHGRDLIVCGDGDGTQDWLYVEDHARALFAILTEGRPGETYGVAAREQRRSVDVVRRICEVLGEQRPRHDPYESLITFVMDLPGPAGLVPVAAGKLETQLGWRAKESFDSGIEKTVRWYLASEWASRPLRERAQAGERRLARVAAN